MSETKGRNREDTNRGRCLSIALHPNERMTVNRPWTCSPTAAVSSTAAISADNSNNYAAPFARASEADRKCLPGYSWPPHLYQDKLSLAELRTKSERNVEWTVSNLMLQLEGPERDVLGSDEEFARENTLGRAAAQGFLGGEADEIGIVVFLRDVGKDEIARNGVEAIGVAKIFAYGVIRKMAGPAENALLDDPRIRADLEHVQIVIGFEDQAIGAAEMHFDEFGHVAQVSDHGHLRAIRTEGETNGVGGVVGNCEGVDVNVADGEMLAGVNRLDAVEPLAESFRKNALHGIYGGFGDVERSFPEAEHLWEAVAVVGVLVGDEDTVDVVDGSFDGSEAGQRFAFAQTGVNEEAGPLGLKQRDVARAAGRQYGYPQADRFLLNCNANKFSE